MKLLSVYADQAQIQLGGETGLLVTPAVGNIVLNPAGVGYKAIYTSTDFMVVGGLLPGRQRQFISRRRDKFGPTSAHQSSSYVPLLVTYPLSSDHGGITMLWHNAEQT